MSAELERIRALETELERTREQVFQLGRLAELGKLIAVVAHELSQPLLGIKAFSQILQRRCDQDEYVGPKVRLILEQAHVMEGIVESLREFSRARPEDPAGVDLGQVAAASVELFSERIRKARIQVLTEIGKGLPAGQGSRGHMQQVVVNLISNALDALGVAPGGQIRLWLDQQDDMLVLRVADNGPGVPDDVRARLFEPFYTTKKEERGTGLGLSICRDILRLRGGDIQLLEPDQARAVAGADCGAVFEVRVPVAPQAAGADQGGGGSGGA